MSAIGLTDHGTIAGVISFIKECRAQDIKPVIGTEAYLARDHKCHSKDGQKDGRKGNRHINIIAKNYKGYQNLCALSQKSSLEGYYYDPRVDFELLDQHKEGIIATTACLSNIVNWNLLRDRYQEAKKAVGLFQDIFGEDYYLEMMFHGIDSQAKILPEIQRLSRDTGVKTIITNDSHYVNKENAEYHEYVMCISSKRSMRDPKRPKFPFHEFYIKSQEEMSQVFGHCPQSMTNTLEIAEKCDYSDIIFIEKGGEMRLPKFDLPSGFSSSIEYLNKLAWDGLQNQGLANSEVHKKRLKQELDDIQLIWDTKRYDFATYFLIVEDIMRFAKEKDISAGVRGSGYGSLLLKCIGIVEGVDPVKFSLLWQRFMSVDRVGFPDIDMDFDYSRRHEIVEHLHEKYGSDKVGNIGTVLTLRTKASIRRAVEVLDPENSIDYSSNKIDKSRNYALQNEILNTLPKIQAAFKKRDGTPITSIKETYDTFSEFARYMRQYPKVYEVACKLEGSIAAAGAHAGGIVLSPIPLENICPLHITQGSVAFNADAESTEKIKTIATQFSMADIESMGLIKFDVLGISTKTAMSLAVKLIKENHGIDIDLANLPLDDRSTLKMLSSGDTNGVFQAENIGMQQTFKLMGIDSFDDIVTAIAMYRPGPKDYIPELAARKKDKSKIKYAHPLMEKITKNTYGIISFQEQIMQVFMALADMSASDGYKFMKGCAKKQKRLIDEYKNVFIKNAIAKKIKPETVNQIWDDLQRFSGYAFCKSHSVSYAHECWKTAYLKANYMLEFMSARMSVETIRREFDYVLKCEDDLRKHGYKILSPDINRSKMHYIKVDEKVLLRPLIIKGVGDKAAEDIIKNQPYKGDDLFAAFTHKVGPSVNTRTIEALYDANLFGNDRTKQQALRDFDVIKKDRKASKGKQTGSIFKK